MYCSSCRNFTYCLFFLFFIFFYFRLIVYIYIYVVVVVFFTVFVSMFVCLHFCFVVLFCLYSLFVFIYCLCYVTVLYQFFFESICCSKMRLKVENYISRIFELLYNHSFYNAHIVFCSACSKTTTKTKIRS